MSIIMKTYVDINQKTNEIIKHANDKKFILSRTNLNQDIYPIMIYNSCNLLSLGRIEFDYISKLMIILN